MVNTSLRSSVNLERIGALLRLYVAVAVATVAVLAVLSAVAPHQAPRDAWGHAVIVAVFAILLPLRLRSARQGSVPALRAVGLIASALFVVNVVEAMLPHFVPLWMRIEMIGIALLMAAIILLVIRERT